MTHYLKIDLQQIAIKLDVEVRYFNDYLKFNEKELSVRQEVVRKQFFEDLIEFPRKDVMEHLYKEDLTKLPSYFYHSSLILVFSIMETTLREICHELARVLALPIKVDELSGNNSIVKSVDFIKKFCELNLAAVDKEWIKIRRFQRIRNLIVHNNAQLPANKNDPSTEEFKALTNIGNTSVDSYGNFFITSSKPIVSFLGSAEFFIRFIIEKIQEAEYAAYSVKHKRDEYFPWDSDDYELPF